MRHLFALALTVLIILGQLALGVHPMAAAPVVSVPMLPAPPDPIITLSPSPISPDTSLTVTGSGWPAVARVQVCISLPQPTCVTVTTASDGSFSVQLLIPSGTPSGTYTVSAQVGTTTPVTAQVQVVANNQIMVSPSPILPGQSALVTGTRFGAGETVVVSFPVLSITGGSAPVQATGVTDSNGSFAINLPIPSNAVAGNYIVTARGLTTGLQATALMTVAAQPSLTVSPVFVTPGATITVSGRRWTSNWPFTVSARVPLVNDGAETLTVSPKADGVGNFTVQLTLPSNAAPGAVTVTVTQTIGVQTYSVSQSVTVQLLQPSIRFSSGTVLPGGSVQVFLSGFSPNPSAPITVLTQVVVQGSIQPITLVVYPDSSGNATTTLSIPSGASPGQITVSATQPASGTSVSGSLQVASVVTNTPTGTPTPLPTNTPTNTPTLTPTNTPIPPPPPPPTPKPRHRLLKFNYLTLWYSVVLVGSFNHIDLQANQRGRSQVDATITFPRGTRLHYVAFTNREGRWSKTFPVPVNAIRGKLRTALVQVRLRKPPQTSLVRSLTFRLVR